MAGKVVVVMNRKGGVGKTAISLALADTFNAGRDAKSSVVLVDLDPQGSATRALIGFRDATGSDPLHARYGGRGMPSWLNAYRRDWRPRPKDHLIENCGPFAEPDYGLVANADEGWDCEIEYRKDSFGARRAQGAVGTMLRFLKVRYDWVIVDCPPGLSLFSEAALKIADGIVCPVVPEPFGFYGMDLFERYLRTLSGRALSRSWFLVNRMLGTNLANEYSDRMERRENPVLDLVRSPADRSAIAVPEHNCFKVRTKTLTADSSVVPLNDFTTMYTPESRKALTAVAHTLESALETAP